MEDRVEINIPTPDPPICDFCSHTPVWKRYECVSFEMHNELLLQSFGIVWASKRDWGACRHCSSLIERGLKQALTNRSFNTFKKKWKIQKWFEADFRKMLTELHEMFWTHRLPTDDTEVKKHEHNNTKPS